MGLPASVSLLWAVFPVFGKSCAAAAAASGVQEELSVRFCPFLKQLTTSAASTRGRGGQLANQAGLHFDLGGIFNCLTLHQWGFLEGLQK